MQDGGTWNTMAGQPTDDSELALLLARSIVDRGKYEIEKVASCYYYWFHESHPFDVGSTIAQSMKNVQESDVISGRVAEVMKANASMQSQANGSLMRISPLALHAYRMSSEELLDLVLADSSLTHPNPVCGQCCALYCAAIIHAITTGCAGGAYERALKLAEEWKVESAVSQALQDAESTPRNAMEHSGWVLCAFQNAFYQLLHSNSFEDGVVDTVMQGGDTDTNAAIAGALLGAVYGRDAVPEDWRRLVLSCRPDATARATHPRPWCLWPVDVMNLAERLLLCG
jgi:ADP-ribosylglycohydrolase